MVCRVPHRAPAPRWALPTSGRRRRRSPRPGTVAGGRPSRHREHRRLGARRSQGCHARPLTPAPGWERSTAAPARSPCQRAGRGHACSPRRLQTHSCALVTLTAVSCPTASVCTAVGYLQNAASHRQPVAIRETGAGGRPSRRRPCPGRSIASLTRCPVRRQRPVRPSAWRRSEVEGVAGRSVERYRVKVTSLPSVLAGSPALAAVSCTAANACTAVGEQGDAGGESGSARTLASIGRRSLGGAVHPIAGVQRQRTTRRVVRVGERLPRRRLVRGPERPARLLGLLWNGAAWSQSTSPASATRPWSRALPRTHALSSTRASRRATCGTARPGHRWPCRRSACGRSPAPAPPPAPPSATGAATSDGTAWTAETIPGPPSIFTGVSCPVAPVCTAVGFRDNPPTRPLSNARPERWLSDTEAQHGRGCSRPEPAVAIHRVGDSF